MHDRPCVVISRTQPPADRAHELRRLELLRNDVRLGGRADARFVNAGWERR